MRQSIRDEELVKSVSLKRFLKQQFPPREPVLKGLLCRQDLAMIYGPRGVGKTFVAFEIAYAVASGGAFGPWKAPKARKVLLLDGEMAGRPLQRRAERIHKAERSLSSLKNLFIVTPDMNRGALPMLDTEAGQAGIEEAMPKDVALIVVDNLSCWTGSAADDATAWEVVSRWARRQRSEGRVVIFMHHANKLGAQRGSSRKEDLLDVVLKLSVPKGHAIESGTKFEVRFEKARELTGKRVRPRLAELQVSKSNRRSWIWSEILTAADRDAEIRRLHAAGESMVAIGRKYGVERTTVWRAVKAVPKK